MNEVTTYLENAKGRLAEAAHRLELTKEQVAELRQEFERLMAEYTLASSELNLVFGSIAAVIFFEQRVAFWEGEES